MHPTKEPIGGGTAMQSNNDQSWLGAWPGFVVAILLALGAVGWIQTPFKAERPTEAKEGLGPAGIQDIDARLWQDPFAAVIEARKAAKESKTPAPECRALEIGVDGHTLLMQSGCAAKTGDAPAAAVDSPATQPAENAVVPRSNCEALDVLADGRIQPRPGGCTQVMTGATSPGQSDRHALNNLARQILARAESQGQAGVQTQTGRPVTVLGVMVSAAPTSGAAEARRRFRYAALSALMLEGFLPDDSRHIGYVELGRQGPPEFVPYEWFTRATDGPGRHQALVLLWLDDGSLAAPQQPPGDTGSATRPGEPRPLARLSKLLTSLAPTGTARDAVGFQIIGPAGSGTLKAMGREYADHLAAGRGPAGSTVARIWSPFATLREADIGYTRALGDACPCATEVPDCVALCPPAPTERTIISDEALAERLVSELRLRRVSGNARIALVGQWDTAYARGLAELLEKAWYGYQLEDSEREHWLSRGKTCRQEDRDPRFPFTGDQIERFSYMRGLDGQVPGDRPKDQANQDAKDIERPAGDAQTDYLRRMAEALLDQDDCLRQVCSFTDRISQRCGIRAIGILGDDYFDKLLVLQALKPYFPDAVFFTTDLSADMLHPRDNAYTRNLIVASGFGLSLAYTWQREVPPLRDNYQTALLLAVHLAVQDSLGIQNGLPLPPPPRLFEIGRTRGIELVTDPQRDENGYFRRDGRPPEEDPHPARDLDGYFRLFPEGQAGVLAVAMPLALMLAVGLGVAAFGWARVGELAKGWWDGLRHGWLTSAIAAFSLAVTALLLWLLARDLSQGGEPFSLLQGVSVWPSECLRLIAGLAAVAFFLRGQHRQQVARDGIERDFPGLGTAAPAGRVAETAQDAHAETGSGKDARGPAPCAELVAPVAGVHSCATEIWARYAGRCGLPKTLGRIWPELLGFLTLAWCLMLLLGFPNHPTRSSLAWGLDLVITLLVMVPFLGLLFFMVDATRQTLGLARDLSKPVAWPASTLESLGLGAWVQHRDGQGLVGADIVWLDVKLIAAVTRPVGNLVWYPVVVLILIALARHPLFDAWSVPPALILVMALAVVYAIGCAWALRRAAERVREEALHQLSAALLRAQGRTDAKDCIEPLRTMMASVIAARDGAFRPFSQQPVVQAMLTLISSLSGLALLDYSSMANF